MAISEFDDDDYEADEDWNEDDSDALDDELTPCPECRKSVPVITGKCPSCGYWFTDADRIRSRDGGSKPLWMRATALILVIALLAGILIEIAIRMF